MSADPSALVRDLAAAIAAERKATVEVVLAERKAWARLACSPWIEGDSEPAKVALRALGVDVDALLAEAGK